MGGVELPSTTRKPAPWDAFSKAVTGRSLNDRLLDRRAVRRADGGGDGRLCGRGVGGTIGRVKGGSDRGVVLNEESPREHRGQRPAPYPPRARRSAERLRRLLIRRRRRRCDTQLPVF
jgi:hypothetical protein